MRPLVPLAIVAAALLAGCGGDSSRAFGESDLPKVVLGPSEGPKGLVYWRQQSGANMFEKEGEEGASGLRILRRHGFLADYGSQFVARSRAAPVQYAESFAIVFRDEDGAGDSLAIFRSRQREHGRDVTVVDSGGLGEESWALRGVFFPGAPPTYFYAWRRDNLMLGFALAGTPEAVRETAARAFAAKMDDRAERV